MSPRLDGPRYRLVLLESPNTRREDWGKCLARKDKIADLFYWTASLLPDQPFVIQDTKNNVMISEEEFFSILQKTAS